MSNGDIVKINNLIEGKFGKVIASLIDRVKTLEDKLAKSEVKLEAKPEPKKEKQEKVDK